MALPNFDALRDLHNSANSLLHSPIIQRALVNHHQEKWIHEVSETSVRMLDVCTNTKEVLILVKDHLHDLQSTFRRVSSGETVGEKNFEPHHHHRKNLKKAMLKRLRSIKGIKNKCITSSNLTPLDENLVVVVNVMREVRLTVMSMVESMLSLMSIPCPNSPTSNRCSLALKIKQLKRVNSLRVWERCDAITLQTASTRLEAVEIVIEDLEVELECMFRRLIQTRVSLLNILTN